MAHGAYVLIVRSFRNFVCGISWALIVAKALFGTSFTRLSVCLYVHTISDFGMGTFRYDFVHSWTLNVNVYCIYEYDSHKLQQQTWTKKKILLYIKYILNVFIRNTIVISYIHWCNAPEKRIMDLGRMKTRKKRSYLFAQWCGACCMTFDRANWARITRTTTQPTRIGVHSYENNRIINKMKCWHISDSFLFVIELLCNIFIVL